MEPASLYEPASLHLFYEPAGVLRLTVGEQCSYPVVKIYQSAPLSKPKEYLSFIDSKGEEICMVRRLTDLSPESQAATEAELTRRYLTAVITTISHVKQEFGVTYWRVQTHRGEREFVVQSLSESCVWLSEKHLLLIDVDGNRFEITDRYALDAPSRKFLELVL
jgi:hypothetical protein